MLSVRHTRAWRVLSCVVIVAAIVVCLLPAADLPKTSINDKFEHTFAYVLLTLWFAGLYPRSRYWVVALGLFLMGVAIEFAQAGMHMGRQGDVRDVVANSTGIVVGIALAFAGLGGWAQWIDGWTRGRDTVKSD
jgi:VanZ family protein